MYIDTGTFWIITIILAVAIAVVYYTLKEKIEKKADFDSEIYILVAILLKAYQILYNYSNKKAQEEAEALFTKHEQDINQIMAHFDEQLKKQQDNNNQK